MNVYQKRFDKRFHMQPNTKDMISKAGRGLGRAGFRLKTLSGTWSFSSQIPIHKMKGRVESGGVFQDS